MGRDKQYVARRENGSYGMSSADRIAVAHICGLPVQWFYVDIPTLLAAIPLETPAAGAVPTRLRHSSHGGEDQQQAP